ncbi:hypothetical protein ACF0H5_005182 [Mactra antiquata]
MSVNKTARIYSNPESTLRDMTLGLQLVGKENLPYAGPALLFSKTEEQKLVEYEPVLAPSWYEGFKKRNPTIALKKHQKLSVACAKATSEEVLTAYFNELESVLRKTGHI